jgi:C1A family cysteine protease
MMKTKHTISANEPVSRLLTKILGKRAEPAIKRLNSNRIETIGQLAGVLQIEIPYLSKKEAQKKGVAATFFLSQAHRRKPETAVLRLQRFLQISKSDAFRIVDACKNIQTRYQHYYSNSGWALGAVRQPLRILGSSSKLTSTIRVKSGFHVVPEYQDAGAIFDQGERGTCVANAACTLLDYKSNGSWSRQFLYHQCKMIDKMRTTEGTTIEAALEILSKQVLVDFGNVSESVWPYNSHSEKTEHQGPPPEKAFACNRLFATNNPMLINEKSKVRDIKNLLNYQFKGKSCPVIIGIPLYESFFSWSTAETGWVTLPLPGEALVGYHAMIIVGYDEDRHLFLVRNSWGPHWAQGNDRGFKGHAWIPFEYIEKYCYLGASFAELSPGNFIIHEDDRLYYRKLTPEWAGRAVASKQRVRNVNTNRKRHITFTGWLWRIAAVILLWHAYKVPITNFKDKILSIIETRIDLNELGSNAKEKWEEIIN